MAFGALRGNIKTGNATSVGTSAPITTGTDVTVSLADLIFVVMGEQLAITSTTCSDTLGNTYTLLQTGVDAGTSTCVCFWSRVTRPGTWTGVTIVTNGGTNNFAGLAWATEGPFAASPLDKNPTHITTDITSPFTCPTTGTLTEASEVVIAFGVATGSTVWAATSPNILVGNIATASILKVAGGSQVVAATTAVIPEFTAAANPADAVLGTVSFKGVETLRPASWM